MPEEAQQRAEVAERRVAQVPGEAVQEVLEA